MTNDELKNLPMYSIVKIEYSTQWQFVGVLVAKWMPDNLRLWQGHVYVEKHDGEDYHSTMWGYVANMSFVSFPEQSYTITGLTTEQRANLATAVTLIESVK